MIICAPALVAILPASILVSMPPRDSSEPDAPAIASISGVMRGTTGTRLAPASDGGLSYSPSTSDSSTKRSALIMAATRAASRSLSP